MVSGQTKVVQPSFRVTLRFQGWDLEIGQMKGPVNTARLTKVPGAVLGKGSGLVEQFLEQQGLDATQRLLNGNAQDLVQGVSGRERSPIAHVLGVKRRV